MYAVKMRMVILSTEVYAATTGPVSKAHVQGGDVVRRVVLLLSRSDELLHRGEPMADLVLMEEVKCGLLRPRRREHV